MAVPPSLIILDQSRQWKQKHFGTSFSFSVRSVTPPTAEKETDEKVDETEKKVAMTRRITGRAFYVHPCSAIRKWLEQALETRELVRLL